VTSLGLEVAGEGDEAGSYRSLGLDMRGKRAEDACEDACDGVPWATYADLIFEGRSSDCLTGIAPRSTEPEER